MIHFIYQKSVRNFSAHAKFFEILRKSVKFIIKKFRKISKHFPSDIEFELIDAIYDRSLPPPNFSLYSRLESRFARLNLLTTNQFSDLTLIADDGEIQAHRILLASGSELMRAMLIGSWRESSRHDIKMIFFFRFYTYIFIIRVYFYFLMIYNNR